MTTIVLTTSLPAPGRLQPSGLGHDTLPDPAALAWLSGVLNLSDPRNDAGLVANQIPSASILDLQHNSYGWLSPLSPATRLCS